MIVVVDARGVSVENPADFADFKVRAGVSDDVLAESLAAAGAGMPTADGHVAIEPEFIPRVVGEAARTESWRRGFEDMIAYAATKGWLTSTGQILAHVERPQPAPRVAVVGLGAQGSGITLSLERLGYDVVAAVDIGDRVGQKVRSLVRDFRGEARVLGSMADLTTLEPALDLVVLSAAVGLEHTLEWAGALLDHGIDIVTLNQDAFAFDDAWAPALDGRAKAGGGTFLGCGVQDGAWVHLISLAAALTPNIRHLSLTSTVPLEVLSSGVGQEIGIGLTEQEFAEHTARHRDVPSVVGAPLMEAARRLGLLAALTSKQAEPIIGTQEYVWTAAGTKLPAGRVHGFREVVTFDVDQAMGITGITGEIAVVPGGAELARDTVVIEGATTLTADLGPITPEVTNASLIARIPDVLAAPPGVLFAADLPAPRYHAPLSSRSRSA